MTLDSIIIIAIFNVVCALITRSFWSDFLDEKRWFCKLWVRILLVIPPFGLITGTLTLGGILLGCICGCIYYVFIEPIISYFKNCDI